MTLDFLKTKSDAPVLIKLYLPFTSINLNSFIRVFVPFLCCHGLCSFFEMFVFVCFSLLLLLLSLCSLVFISGKSFISSSKDVAASTTVVELILRTITLAIVYFYRVVVNSTLKNFSQWSWLRLEMRLCKLFSVNHTKLNINETNTYSKVNYKNTSETSNFVAL